MANFGWFSLFLISLDYHICGSTGSDDVIKMQRFSVDNDVACTGSALGSLTQTAEYLKCFLHCVQNGNCAGLSYNNGICQLFSCSPVSGTTDIGGKCASVVGGGFQQCGMYGIQ